MARRFVVRRRDLLKKQDNRCAYCGKPLPRRGWHRDHIEPLVRFRGVRWTFSGRNGCKHPERHRPDNIVAACAACNKDKGSMDLETWRASLRWPGWREGVVFWFEREGA